MFIDGRSIPDGSIVDTDVCIVGAGPAGISLALRLAAGRRLSIVLLESGGLTFDPEAQALARGATVELPYYPLHETRVRMLGGSSQSWGGICTPLERPATTSRPWVSLPGWPIPPEALDPYLAGALERCGVDRAMQAADQASHREVLASWPLDATRIAPMLVHFSRPLRFGAACRPELAASPAIAVHLDSTVTELLAGPAGTSVHEAVVRSLRGVTHRVRARAFVLAGGGVENARLLLASTHDQPAGLGNGRDMVGRYFMEHPRVPVHFRVRAGPTPLGRLVGGGASGTLRFRRIGLAPEVQEREQLLTWHANVQFGYAGQDGSTWPAVRRLAIAARAPWNESPFFQDGGGGTTRLRSADIRAVLRRPDRALLGVIAAVRAPDRMRRWIEIYSATEQVPDPANRIELTRDRDPLGVPRVRITWRVGADEERTHRRAVSLSLEEFEKLEPGISSRSLDEVDPWPSAIVGTWHHLGATRMSADPATGVVDGDCRVHGIANLFIAGSSVFPIAASTAPTVTIVALAHRLADHLADVFTRERPASIR